MGTKIATPEILVSTHRDFPSARLPTRDVTLEMMRTGNIWSSVYTGFTVQENFDRYDKCEDMGNRTYSRTLQLFWRESATGCTSRKHDLKVETLPSALGFSLQWHCVYSWSAKQQDMTSFIFCHADHVAHHSLTQQTRSLVATNATSGLQSSEQRRCPFCRVIFWTNTSSLRGWDNSGCIRTGYGLNGPGPIPGRGNKFFSSPLRPDQFCGSPSFLSCGYWGLFPWGYSDRYVKLTTHLHLLPRPRMVELYFHSPIRHHGVMFN
jgi:hypothetical protein